MNTLELIPRGWLSSGFNVLREGSVAAEIVTSWWNGRGVLRIDCSHYEVYSEGRPPHVTFILEANTARLAHAEKSGCWSRSFTIKYLEKTYSLKPKSWFSGSFLLLENDQEVGSIKAHGFWRAASVHLPDEFPMPVQVFVMWLVTVQWRSDGATAVG